MATKTTNEPTLTDEATHRTLEVRLTKEEATGLAYALTRLGKQVTARVMTISDGHQPEDVMSAIAKVLSRLE